MVATTSPIASTTGPLGTTNPLGRENAGRLPSSLPGGGTSPIPVVSLGPQKPTSSVPNGPTLNETASTAQERQQMLVAENAVLRLIYGRQLVGAQVADVLAYAGNLVIFVIWGEGNIHSVEQIYFDDKVPPATGYAATHYTGTQVAADPTLVAAYAAQSPAIPYTDILPGIAYSVITLGPGTAFPSRINAIIKGLKVYDPRDGTQTLGTPSTYKYSDCPSLAEADVQTNTTYGAGDAIDWTTVTTAANANDALVGGTEKRRTIGLVMDQVRDAGEWFETLRAYAGCFLARNGAQLLLIPDRPTASSFTFAEAGGNCRIKNVRRRTKRDVPTVCAVRYTDTTAIPWRDNLAYAYATGVLAGTVSWKVREVAMPGITRETQAVREAIEQLNKLALTDLTFDIEGQDEALAVTVGDVVTATANVGVSARAVRVINAGTPSLGRPIFSVEGYDPAVYSDSVATGPTVIDTALPNPGVIAAPTLLNIVETVFIEKSGGSSLAGGLIYQSRLEASWTPPVYAFPLVYRVEVWDGATKIRDEIVTASYSSPPVQQGNGYTVKVFSRNRDLGIESPAPVTGTITALGKLLPPGPVQNFTGRELGGILLLKHDGAVDIDVMRYEYRYFPNGTGTWATATFIDRVDGLTAEFRGLPVGTHRVYARAIDSVGNYSTSDATVDITVTSDANAFIQDHTFSAPTLTNMISMPVVEGVNLAIWATNFATDAFTAVEPNPFNSGANPVISYHAAGTSKFQGESWDLGNTVSGDWTLTPSTVNVSGVATYSMETSPDGTTWTAQPGISFKGSTRFIRPVIQTTGTMIITAPVKIAISSLAKPESGVVTTLASGGKLVQFDGTYSALQDRYATAVNTAVARTVSIDRILVNPQTGLVHQFDYNGSGDNFAQQLISTFGRVILAGDYIEYDVFIDPTSPAASAFSNGGFYMHFTDTSDNSGIAATDGYQLYNPAVAMDALARGIWYSRKASLAAAVGKTSDKFILAANSDAVSGTAKTLYRNIRITDGAGTDRQSIWSSGEPQANSVNSSNLTTNIQAGPSNSMLLYAFTSSTGAQVASDAAWGIKGI